MDKKTERILFRDVTSVLDQYPGLTIVFDDDIPVRLFGTYHLRDNSGALQGGWEIMIPVPANYPYEFPVLFEISGLIPPTPERHMSAQRIACTELTILAEARSRRGITLLQFLQDYVDRYFSWQVLYESGHAETLESWGHGDEGTLEFLYGTLSTDSHSLIKLALALVEQRSWPARNDRCFCQSGRKFKVCHERGIKTLLNTMNPDAIIACQEMLL